MAQRQVEAPGLPCWGATLHLGAAQSGRGLVCIQSFTPLLNNMKLSRPFGLTSARLISLSKIFSRKSIDVSIASLSWGTTGDQDGSSHKVGSLEDLQKFLDIHETRSSSGLVITIPQEYSWGRLCITDSAFQALTKSLKPFGPFLELVGTFGFRTNADERPFHGWRGCALADECQAEKHELCYNIQYVERHGRELKDPWSLRQTGVYHQYSGQLGSPRWVVINPSAKLGHDIIGHVGIATEDSISRSDSVKTWSLHAELLFKLGSNWTEYVEYLASELAAQNNKACYSSIDSAESQGYTLAYADLQELHLLQAKIQTAATTLTSCIDNGKGCRTHIKIHAERDSNLRRVFHLFDTYEADMVRNLSQVRALETRLKCTLDLLTKLLMFRNEELLHNSNRASCKTLDALLDLSNQGKQQQETLNGLFWRGYADSAMLKALSVVATVCLPASLVATIFSSNLVQAGDPERRNGEAYLVLSHQFWVYIAISLPLMVVVLVWILYLGYRSRQGIPSPVKEDV
ncbi:hypothetical protein BJX64DRAFT_151707 [Aspergillus heterothallicus]